MKLVLIRHLPTVWNQKYILQGQKDIPISTISDNDMRIIERNKQRLAGLDFQIVLTSSLKRTQQTAIAYGYMDFQVEPLLNELNFGVYEGRKKDTMFNEVFDACLISPQKLILGESFDDFACRLKKFLYLYKEFDRILMFGHGAVIRALLSIQTFGKPDFMNTLDINNNSISELCI